MPNFSLEFQKELISKANPNFAKMMKEFEEKTGDGKAEFLATSLSNSAVANPLIPPPNSNFLNLSPQVQTEIIQQQQQLFQKTKGILK